MKVATYNVMSGGFSSYDSPVASPERLPELQEAVATIDADIIGLIDTFRWAEVFSATDLQKLFGYAHTYHVDMNDTRVDKRIGLAWLSRVPVQRFETVHVHNRNAIKASVWEGGAIMELFLAYLDDLDEDVRIKEAKALRAATDPSVPTVIMGDLNTLAPADVAPVKHGMDAFFVLDAHKHLAGLMKDQMTQAYRAEVLPLLKTAGFAIPTAPSTPTAFTGIHPSELPPIFPIDQILGRGVAIRHKTVRTHGIFEYASDHYPLTADIVTERSRRE